MTQFFPAGSGRAQRRWSIVDALRRYGSDSVRLGHAFSSLHRLQPTDLQALVAVMSAEGGGAPLTPGGLRTHLGLSSGGTSYVIDRLEKAGHVLRSRDHPTDNRIVHLHYTEQGMATGMAFFGPLGQRANAVLDKFSDHELEVIARFAEAYAEALRQHLVELEEPPTR